MTLYKTANQALKKNMHFAFFFFNSDKGTSYIEIVDITHFKNIMQGPVEIVKTLKRDR